MLPTFWTEQERLLLIGTTLKPAVDAKLKGLYREFDHLRSSSEAIQWCRECWWDEVDGIVDFDDWKQLDAMYRSRALEFPGIGDAMVPSIDMANHAADEATVALYEADEDGNATLILREGKSLSSGNEVTITFVVKSKRCVKH